jgi:hypothetical protein
MFVFIEMDSVRMKYNRPGWAIRFKPDTDCHHRCKVNPPTTGKETHLAVIYSLPRGNYFSFQKPSKPVGKKLLKEK